MCMYCWKDYGEHKIENTKTRLALHLMKGVYFYHGTGGHLHVILDDWNITDELVDHYIEKMKVVTVDENISQKCINIERVCIKIFKSLTIPERNSVLAKYDNYF